MLSRFILCLFFFCTISFSAVLRSTVPFGCSPGVARATHFMFSTDYGNDSYTPAVDDYLSGKPPVGVVTDIETSIALATSVWKVTLLEFGSLNLQTCRGGETLCRVGMIVKPEVLPHRLTMGFVIHPQGPSLFAALPERASANDLQHLRNTIFYGMGLGAFDAVASRESLRLFRMVQSSEPMERPQFAIDDDWRRAQSRRRDILNELPQSHLRAAADLFAYGFGREAARRSGLPTQDFDELMKLTGLEQSAIRLKMALDDTADGAAERALSEWGSRIVKKARELRSQPVPRADSLPEIDSSLTAKIGAVRVAKPDAGAFREAQEGLRRYGESLEARRLELVAERVKALDDLIVRDVSP